MMDRSACLNRWRADGARGIPILGAGAGTGISAKCAEAAGADLIIIYNSGRYRMAGRGSLAGLMPYGDANAIVMEMAREVLPIVRKTPVLAGVCGTFGLTRGTVLARELEIMYSRQNGPDPALAERMKSIAAELHTIIESRK